MRATPARSAASGTDRLGALDAAKGACIVCVVGAHVLSGLADAGVLGRRVNGLYAGFAYAFMMPVFFAAAGLFVERGLARGPGQFAADKLRTVAWPYVVWLLVYAAALAVTGSARNGEATAWQWLTSGLHRPPGHLWFLYALLLCLAAYAALRLARLPRWAILVAAVAWRVGGDPWSSGLAWTGPALVRENLAFLAVGACVGPQVLAATSSGRYAGALSWVVALITAAALGVAVIAGVARSPIPTWWGAALGLVFAASASVLLDRTPLLGPGLRWLGLRSLQVYVAHVLATAGTRIALLKAGVGDPAVHVAAGWTAGLAVPLLLAAVADRSAAARLLFALPRPGPARPDAAPAAVGRAA